MVLGGAALKTPNSTGGSSDAAAAKRIRVNKKRNTWLCSRSLDQPHHHMTCAVDFGSDDKFITNDL